MKKRLRELVLLVVAVGMSSIAWATPGAEDTLLAQQLAELRTMVVEAKNAVKEMKVVSDEVYEVRDTLDEAYRTYNQLQSLRNEDPGYYLRQWAGLTNLDSLKDAETWQEKYALLHGEVSLRFARSELPTGGAAQKAVHGTLFGIQATEVEIERINQQLAAIRADERVDASTIATEAQLINARSELEKKIAELKKLAAQQKEVMNMKSWQVVFAQYLEDGKLSGTEAMQDSWYATMISAILNPEHIYANLAKLGGILGGLALFFYTIFSALRLLSVSLGLFDANGEAGRFFADSLKGLLGYAVYLFVGGFVFLLIFAFIKFLGSAGGLSYIHSSLMELRVTLLTEDTAGTEDTVFGALMTTGFEIANMGTASLSTVVFHLISVCYVFITRLIDVVFAIGFGFVWMFAALAIMSQVLGEGFSLTKGWIITVYSLFLWAVVDFALVMMLALISYGATTYMESRMSGFGIGITVTTYWNVFASLMMVLVVVVRVIAFAIASLLVNQQSATIALGAIPAAATAIAGSAIFKRIADSVGAGVGGTEDEAGMAPRAGGERRRDKIAGVGSKLSDIGNANVGDLWRSGKESMKELSDRLGLGNPLSDGAGPVGPDSGSASSGEPLATEQGSGGDGGGTGQAESLYGGVGYGLATPDNVNIKF